MVEAVALQWHDILNILAAFAGIVWLVVRFAMSQVLHRIKSMEEKAEAAHNKIDRHVVELHAKAGH